MATVTQGLLHVKNHTYQLTSPHLVLQYMGNVDGFLKSLINFDKDNTPENCVAVVEKEYMSNAGFTPDNIRSKSSAAAGLSGWVINICKYFRIYQVRVACKCVSMLAHTSTHISLRVRAFV